MHRNDATHLILKALGNHRRRNVLSVLTFPGLSIDQVAGTPASGGGQSGGLSGNPGSGVGQQVADLSKQLNDLRTAQQTQVDKLNENTQALARNTAAKSSGAALGGGGNILSSLFGSAFGLAPIFTGLFDLFGGSRNSTPQPLTPFSLPPSIQYAGGLIGSGAVTPVDYGQNGQARPATANGPANNQPAPVVQIQVNAMDSRSFLDHSEDIARAVRQAMLHSSSLNDVIADL